MNREVSLRRTSKFFGGAGKWPLSFDILEREVRANMVYRIFTRVGAEKVPDAKTLARSECALGPEVFQKVQGRIVEIAREKKAVEGRKMRVDTTVTETNIPLASKVGWIAASD